MPVKKTESPSLRIFPLIMPLSPGFVALKEEVYQTFTGGVGQM